MINLSRAVVVGGSVMLVLGCGVSRSPDATTHQAPETEEPAKSVGSIPPSSGFSWIIPDQLAAMPLPGRDRPLDQDAAFLEQEGIGLLVSLTDEPPDRDTLMTHSINQAHIPVQDFAPPTPEQITEFVSLVEDSVATGTPVGVHCTAGLGRSGTMAAVYLVSTGFSAQEAIAAVRDLRPGSIETEEQENAIRQFEKSFNSAH